MTLGAVKDPVHTPDGHVSRHDGIDKEQSLRTLQIVIDIDQNLGM